MKVKVQLNALQEEDKRREEIQLLFENNEETAVGTFRAWITRSNVPCGIVEMKGGFFIVVSWHGMTAIN